MNTQIYCFVIGRGGGEVGGKGFVGTNHPHLRSSYTKAVQQQELLHHESLSQTQSFPAPHHYSMTMGSRRGSKSNLSGGRNMSHQTHQLQIQRSNQHSFDGRDDFSNIIPPLPLHCLGFVCLSYKFIPKCLQSTPLT